MKRDLSAIRDKHVPKLIRRLITFLGGGAVEASLHKYKESLRSSEPVYREYYLKMRHPWWDTLVAYKDLRTSGKATYRNLTNTMFNLAGDAKKVCILTRHMPASVREKYRRDLLDAEGAKAYLFELDIAWHYYIQGHQIIWHEDAGEKHPEFTVVTDDLAFDVECKRIGVDAFRKIRRRDFYHLVEALLPEVSAKGLIGRIDLVLLERLSGNLVKLRSLAQQLLHRIGSGGAKGRFSLDCGHVVVEVKEGTNKRVDLQQMQNDLWLRKPPEAHGAIFARSYQGGPVDPIEMTCRSKKADKVLLGIRRIICEASSKQLNPTKPGLIACYIPEIDDFRGLGTNTGLQLMTNSLFSENKRCNLAAVTYSSDTRMVDTNYGKISNNQALIFRNPYCKFDAVQNFPFIGSEAID